MMYEFVDLRLSILHFNELGKPLADKLSVRVPSSLISSFLQTASLLLANNKVLESVAAAWRKSPSSVSAPSPKQHIQRFSVPSLLPSTPLRLSTTLDPVKKSEPVTVSMESVSSAEPETFVKLANAGDIDWLGGEFASLVELLNDGIYEHAPELCDDCEGGTYFLLDSDGQRAAVFKPVDEDPQAVNNPKRKDESPARNTIPQGGTAQREVAAFLIDRGFAGVPETALARVKHPAFNGVKLGSLQRFVEHDCGAWDMPPYRFATDDVHRIALFDLRCFNTDRHGGNMLAVRKAGGQSDNKEGTHGLVPIDHGFAFPTAFGEENFEWRFWPQAKRPFSAETRQLVAAMSVAQDCEVLRAQGLCEQAIWMHRVMGTFVQKGVAAGATLGELAELCCRKRQQPSQLESICLLAQEQAKQEGSDFWALLDGSLDGLFTGSTRK